MHGCSSARTKSMAVAIVSTWAMVLASAGGPCLGLDDEKFMVAREKSCGGLQPDIFIREEMGHQPLGRSGVECDTLLYC